MYGEELDIIFNDDYFDNDYEYDEANENTALKKGLLGGISAIIGGLPAMYISMIGNIVHNCRVSSSTVTSLRECISVYGEQNGTKMYKKTLNYFVSNDLVNSDFDPNSTKLKFNQLNKRGKEFMRGYYNRVNEIRKFDFEEIAAAKRDSKANAEAIVSTALTPVQIARLIIDIIVRDNMIKAYNAKVDDANLIMGMFGGDPLPHKTLNLPAYIVAALIPTTFNIIDAVRSFKASNTFNDVVQNAKESAYEDGYYQALADMGYEFDDAEEDVDIFDEDCFDDAVEGFLKNIKEESIRADKATIVSSRDMIKSMKPSERNKAWTGMIRTLKIKGYLPAEISPNCEQITQYDLYNSKVLRALGHGDMYSTGIQLLNRVIHEEFTNSTDAVDYLKELIANDQDIRDKRAAAMKDTMDRINQERMLRDMYAYTHR